MPLMGHVQKGVVVFDESVALPAGTAVEVAVRDSTSASRPSLWDRLKDVVGEAEGLPPDASSRIGHYLTHGLPKE